MTSDFEQRRAEASVVELKTMFDSGKYDERKKIIIWKQVLEKEEEARLAERAADIELQQRATTAAEGQARYAQRALWVSIVAIIVSLLALGVSVLQL